MLWCIPGACFVFLDEYTFSELGTVFRVLFAMVPKVRVVNSGNGCFVRLCVKRNWIANRPKKGATSKAEGWKEEDQLEVLRLEAQRIKLCLAQCSFSSRFPNLRAQWATPNRLLSPLCRARCSFSFIRLFGFSFCACANIVTGSSNTAACPESTPRSASARVVSRTTVLLKKYV